MGNNDAALENLLYPLQSYDYETGTCSEGRQVVMGLLCPHLVAFFFDAQGRLRNKETRFWETPAPQRDGIYLIYDEAFETALTAQKNAWQQEIGFLPGTIRIKRFFDEECFVGIEILPDHYLDLENEDCQDDADERQELIKSRDAWLERGDFVWWWAKDYYMNSEGEVEST